MEERFKIAVAVYLILKENNKILLQLRDGTKYMKGYYGVPSGHLEEGEGCVNALIREVKEETNIDIKEEDLKLEYISNRISDKEYLCFFFSVRKYEGEIKIMEPHKCKELKFFDMNNLPKNIVPELKNYFIAKENGYIYGETDYKRNNNESILCLKD